MLIYFKCFNCQWLIGILADPIFFILYISIYTNLTFKWKQYNILLFYMCLSFNGSGSWRKSMNIDKTHFYSTLVNWKLLKYLGYFLMLPIYYHVLLLVFIFILVKYLNFEFLALIMIIIKLFDFILVLYNY